LPVKQEILFYLSGGLNNRDPDKSLGGGYSNTVIWNGLDNLFDDFTIEEEYGFIDYRCFYIKNGGENDWTDVTIYMANEQESSCAIGMLGIEESDEVQQLNIISNLGAIGGSFNFDLGGDIATVDYNSDIDVWANNFENALASIGFLDTVIVGKVFSDISSPQYQNKTFQIFQITFTDSDGRRNQSLIIPGSNNLIMQAGDSSTLTSSKVIRGAPINTEAPQIPSQTTPPANIVFIPSTRDAPIFLGTLKPGDYVPVWIKRESQQDTTSAKIDQFVVGLRGTCSVF